MITRLCIQSCNSVLKIDKNNYEAYFFRGLAYIYLEKYQPAISDFEQAIRLEPNFAFSYFGRGFARVQLQQYQQSIGDFEQPIKIVLPYLRPFSCKILSAQTASTCGSGGTGSML
ncbi:tetratricopeptide repeat protein [Iningainema tapete]|uniref:Tetratricopeptide repeat protein n=1 Tax=Iningainema tapete BLCC-T55 TaxID=2748662 RepID=A0A8J6XRH8_9CYAN|nr:tetratricopeptide repeat protein [Iningainema tapete]MBD2772273.1 tetratricopeptide repeat protein [Iningainema tapete BLCC-T55]